MRGRALSAWRAASRPGLAAFAACRRGLTPPTTWLATPLGDRVCRDLGGKQGPSDLRCLGSPLQSWLGVCPRTDAIVLDSNITELSRGHSVVAMRCNLIIPLHSSTVVCHCSTSLQEHQGLHHGALCAPQSHCLVSVWRASQLVAERERRRQRRSAQKVAAWIVPLRRRAAARCGNVRGMSGYWPRRASAGVADGERVLCVNKAFGLNLLCTHGLVAMTSAQHAEGRQFDPGWVYYI